MAELEKNLKPKEKENIKAFKAIPVPSGYASWDKQKLVDYWSTTAFAHSGLLPKGLVGKNPARKKLSNMKVAAPAPAAAAEQKPAATTEQKPAANAAAQPASVSPAADPAQTPAPAAEANLDSAQAALDEAKILAEAALADEDPMIQKENSHTWIYVVVLCILVAVVVALVVFASNVMKKSAVNPQWPAAHSDESKALSKKLKEATNRVEDLEQQNKQLKKRIEALTAEITKLRTRPAQPNPQQEPIRGIPYPKPAPTAEPAPAQPTHAQAEPAPQPQPVEAPHTKPAAAPVQAQRSAQTVQPQMRTIYLGRANAKQIFIRADRTLNTGNSIFRLDTSDGLAGTFKVVNDPSVIELVRQHPAEMLSAACVGPNLANTDGLETIVTDSAGTAIFEGGRWIVMRKAKIHYE